ncbi:WhiB family transcriptional regulator [Nonomuraea fuscirosea]|uniref:WhiB family transcriptional regulator n=1 Tax=Nonomuraea TaxID=83681 RepID=UPI0033D22998
MSWMYRAACRDVDPEIFFPIASPDTDAGTAAEAQAKRVCSGCTVREECLGASVSLQVVDGVWGGHSEAERRRLRLGGRAS